MRVSLRIPRTDRRRRGMALLDVLIGGVMLGIGLSVILSLTSRSLALQTDGEKRMTASWLADEILTMILVEGPDRYPRLYDTSGRYSEPFDGFSYEVQIEDLGRGAPYRATARVRWSDRSNDVLQVETLIALRIEAEEQLREPYDRVDRIERYYEDEAE